MTEISTTLARHLAQVAGGEYLQAAAAAALIGVSRSTLYELAKRHDDFPSPVSVAGCRPRYRRADLLEWARRHEGAA